MDRNAEAIKYANEHWKLEGNDGSPNATFTLAKLDKFKASNLNATFDAVVCFETIEHIEDPLPMLKEFTQLAPLLICSVTNQNLFPYRDYKFHYRHYMPQEIEELLVEAGWEVLMYHGQPGNDGEAAKPQQMREGKFQIITCQRISPDKAFRNDVWKRLQPPATTVAQPPKPGEVNFEGDAGKPAAPPVCRNRQQYCTENEATGKHVAIVGLGPSSGEYLQHTKMAGRPQAEFDEVWGMNALGSILKLDRLFHMDDVRVQEIRAKSLGESNISNMLKFLKTIDIPVYTSRTHDDYPALVEYPLEEVVNATGELYFNSTAAYAIGFAIYSNVRKISCYGMDFTYPDATYAEAGRGCCEFWLGVAQERGIELRFSSYTSLLDSFWDAKGQWRRRVYGYDTMDMEMKIGADGIVKITKTPMPEEQWPTFKEIEDRYDHSRHPNPHNNAAGVPVKAA